MYNNDAPIIPGVSLGGFQLGSLIEDYRDLLDKYGIKKEMKYQYKKFITYIINDIELTINNEDFSITSIKAIKKYKGKLFGEIYLGMSIGDAMRVHPDIYWDEDEDVCSVRGRGGVCLILEDAPKSPMEDLSNKIFEIIIYNY